MRPDPAQRTFLSLLGVAAAITSTICAFSSAFFHGEARVDAMHADERLLGVALTAALAVLVISGAVRCARDVSRRLAATSHYVGVLSALEAEAPPQVLAMAERHGVAGGLLWLETHEPVALTVGFVRPRVALSRGLLTALDGAELDAVLAHEAYHVRHRDPLRALVVHAAAAAFYFLPLVGRLGSQYEAHAEVAADRDALDQVGPRPVAGALTRLLSRPHTGLAATAAMGGSTALEARVLQLETGRDPGGAVAGWAGGAVVFALMVALLDGILLLLGLHTRVLPTALDAVVHMAMFLAIWAASVVLPPHVWRLTAALRRRISTT